MIVLMGRRATFQPTHRRRTSAEEEMGEEKGEEMGEEMGEEKGRGRMLEENSSSI